MRPEPRVDAGEVEGVTTLGEELDGLSVSELAKADGAVSPVDEPVVGLVDSGRDGLDDRVVEANGPDVPHVVRHVVVVPQIVGVGIERRRGVMLVEGGQLLGLLAAAAAAAEKAVEEEDEKEGEGEEGSGGYEDALDEAVLVADADGDGVVVGRRWVVRDRWDSDRRLAGGGPAAELGGHCRSHRDK